MSGIKLGCLAFCMCGSFLLSDLSASGDDFTMTGNFKAISKKDNYIDFKCSNGLVKLELCDEDLVRIRMSPTGSFRKDEHWVVINYNWPKINYTIRDKGAYFEIRTSKLIIKAWKNPFSFDFYDINGKLVNRDWHEGSMGFRKGEVICRKELTTSDHFFGLGQRFEESDLRGKKRTCLVTREYTPVPFFLGSDGYGIFFHNTLASEFDFTKNPYTFYAPGGDELDYYFIYGPEFKHILSQYSRITGFSPLPPKWAFGLYFSRWDQSVDGWNYRQEGQDGMLRTIKAIREVWDWPLDGIRVHSMGPTQNFYASPKTSWPATLWGTFPSIDTMIAKLHGQHVHALFWEGPGVTKGCPMYEEGVKNNYFLTRDGKPAEMVFGYLQPAGSVVDFLNPEARKWWGKYHRYMAEFGSDGVAGDWSDEKLIRNTSSPSTGMESDEYINIFSLLFNQASWDAYRLYSPDKRCINFGLTYWAGGQRYPMQGTQDSDAEGKIIFGEMMGTINLGLSGIPFRTYTDNISRSLLPGLPYGRLSQFMALSIAGERTLCSVTGNEAADHNYRYYGKLKYRLMPYLYTYAREASQKGIPVMRAMVLENQNDTNSYSAYCQYMYGKDILLAPLWSDTTFYRSIYLPEGKWIDFFDETSYDGRQEIRYHAPIDRVPIFIRAGAIIPMAPDNQHYIDEITSPLTINFYPHGSSAFDLYEDDGKSYEYEKGLWALTTYLCNEEPGSITIEKKAPSGNYNVPDTKELYCIHSIKKPVSVTETGKLVSEIHAAADLNQAEEGWIFDSERKMLTIKAGKRHNEAVKLNIRMN
jgi:alpha-glucosidase